VRLDGVGLAVGAVRPAEADGWVALRAVNHTARTVAGAWCLAGTVAEARLARLDETPGDVVPVARAPDGGACLRFVAAPRAAVTMLVRPG
jgi:hypothetical protein